MSREQAIDRLLSSRRLTPIQVPPALEFVSPVGLKNLSDEERKALIREEFRKGLAARAWWLQEMISAPTPADALRERMTLFWHSHFVSSQQKVKSAQLMLQQNLLLRRHALGNFPEILHALSKDPAMIVYLDSASNRKGSPNENFAREVMELFTLGEGHYSEQDIKEAARAFTGWSLERESARFLWREQAHDHGVKRVLGVAGDFDGDAVLDLLLRQPATAEFIVDKLWREFVSPEPDVKESRRIAAIFRSSGYDIKTALRELLVSPAFWARENRATLIKSPYVADGVVIASSELGPLAGGGVRAIALTDTEQFARQAKLAHPGVASGNAALQHLLKVEGDVATAATRLSSGYLFRTGFPRGAFGNAVKAGCQVVASGSGVAALRLTLNGFDTHQNQPETHANLLKQLAEGLLALKDALGELGRWDDTLVMTYSEFGRRPRENQSNGTDHGTAAPHFVLGGRVRGGLYGEAPKPDRLDGNGNLPFSLDYRCLYATVLERWWGISSATLLGAHYPALEFIRS